MSDILRGFCLPSLADAMAKEERQQAEDELLAGFESLKKRFGNG